MAEPLWTPEAMTAATGGRLSAPFAPTGISIDSRDLAPGDLFVALSDRRDGHDFVAAAMAAGASGALVNRPVGQGPELIVPDTLAALTRLGLAARDRADAVRVAVTGSVGKTSVKEMVARIFRAAGPAHASVKSFNNQWGVPLTLARMPRVTARAVFEIGMSTPGEIAPRSEMVRPHGALVTVIAPAHLEGLGSLEAIADEKADIFAGLEAGGAICLPAESPYFERMAARALGLQPHAEIFTFGETGEAAVAVTEYQTDGQTCRVSLSAFGEPVTLGLGVVGRHWAVNAAAAVLLACVNGAVTPREAAAALEGYAAPEGRGGALSLPLAGGGAYTLVDDAYNANPASMEAGLSAFAARPARRRFVALGEMRELGPDAEALHAGLAGAVLAVGPEKVFLAGPLMRPLAEALGGRCDVEWQPTAEALAGSITNAVGDGDALLIKGSNASGMGRLVRVLRDRAARGGASVESQNGTGGSHAV